jgi:predicted ATPase
VRDRCAFSDTTVNTMLRRVEFENFMSLKNVGVDLLPLNVFIGPNGSGKSAIFKGLVTLSKLLFGAAVRGPKGEFFLEPGVTLDDLVWNGNSGLPVKFRVWFDGDRPEPDYTLELSKRGEGWGVVREKIRTETGWIEVDEENGFSHLTERRGRMTHDVPMRGTLSYLVHPFAFDSTAATAIAPIIQLGERFGRTYRYRPSASDIAAFVTLPKEAGSSVYVQENGRGVAAELQMLSQGGKRERETFKAIENAICTLFPHVRAISFKSDWQGVRLTYLTDRSEDPIPAPQESDGVLMATFLFWRLYTGEGAVKVCLEEPENGLHPFLLAERFQALKAFAYGTPDRPGVQILLSTHSPEFLRALKADPKALWKELRIVDFTKGTGTCVKTISNYPEVTKLIEKYLDEVHERWEPIVKSWSDGK